MFRIGRLRASLRVTLYQTRCMIFFWSVPNLYTAVLRSPNCGSHHDFAKMFSTPGEDIVCSLNVNKPRQGFDFNFVDRSVFFELFSVDGMSHEVATGRLQLLFLLTSTKLRI